MSCGGVKGKWVVYFKRLRWTNHVKTAPYQLIEGAGHEVNQQAPQSLAEIITVFYKEIV